MALDYIVVVDFEATCIPDGGIGRTENQIIEFAAILVDVQKKKMVEEFHSFCKPVGQQKILSQYCLDLTGVSQSTVDSALEFPKAFNNFEAWLTKHGLLSSDGIINNNWLLASDSVYDFNIFLYNQCLKISRIPYPAYALEVLTVGPLFKPFYLNMPYHAPIGGMDKWLEHLNMTFEGRRHCGIDDARNVAAIYIRMIEDGVRLRKTDRVDPTRQSPASSKRPKSCLYTVIA